MDENLKNDWKQTGDTLGKAFRDLGRTLILSTKTGMERAIDWAENSEYVSKTVETTAEEVPSADAREEPEVVSVAEEIRRLAQLRDDGILTEEEFQAKKQQLLGL